MENRGKLSLIVPRLWWALVVVLAVAMASAVSACATDSPSSEATGTGLGQTAVAGTLDDDMEPVSQPAAQEAPMEAAPTATAVPTPAPTPSPSVDLRGMKVNELGTIPILQYHLIGDEDGRWERSVSSFRQDLQTLYDAGYRPISLNDLLDGRIDIPAGTSPVVFTFDDSSPGQFRFVERGGRLVVDPNSAVGIMEEFHASHPDFLPRATFYVLPAADPPHNLFGQDEYQAEKLRYLVNNGMEIGNHTYWHQRLDQVDGDEVQHQLAMAVKVIQEAVPGYQVRSLALPLGMWPANLLLAIQGTSEGTYYRHEAVLLVGSEPAPSPYSRGYDPHALPRVQIFGDSLDRWLSYLDSTPDERYVSDGDPDTISFPQHLEDTLNTAALGDGTVQPY